MCKKISYYDLILDNNIFLHGFAYILLYDDD